MDVSTRTSGGWLRYKYARASKSNLSPFYWPGCIDRLAPAINTIAWKGSAGSRAAVRRWLYALTLP